MLKLTKLSYQQRLADVSCHITTGSCVFLLGPNGSGKSTLLSILAGQIRSFSGDCQYLSKPISSWSLDELALRRAWLPQSSPPPFAIPVYQFIALGLHPIGLSLHNSKVQPVILRLLQRLDLLSLVQRNCDQLSGGEWQRVLIARTLLQISPKLNANSSLCLLDEPLTGLDLKHQIELLAILHELSEQGITIIASVHDMNIALNHASEVIMLRAGRLYGQGRAQEILTPARIKEVYDVDIELHRVNGRQFLFSGHPQ